MNSRVAFSMVLFIPSVALAQDPPHTYQQFGYAPANYTGQELTAD